LADETLPLLLLLKLSNDYVCSTLELLPPSEADPPMPSVELEPPRLDR
jgi:hypothetical protein